MQDLTFKKFLGILAVLALCIAAGWVCNNKNIEEKPTVEVESLKSAKEQPKLDDNIAKTPAENTADIEKRIAKFVPVKMSVDESAFPIEHAEWMKPVLAKLVKAADVIDEIFLMQVDEKNPETRARIAANPSFAKTLELFDMMYGPWDRMDDNKPFFGDRKKPIGAGFYPRYGDFDPQYNDDYNSEDITKETIEKWIKDHPEDKEKFESYFTVIARTKNGLVAMPYNMYYHEHLAEAARLLLEAANLSRDAWLSRFLKLRAEAFLSNNYRESDMAWMDLGDCPIEVVIGPYETYEDGILGLKASFEAFVTIRDPKDSAELQSLTAYLPEWQKNLPMPDKYKKFPIKDSPLSVVEEVYAGGDARKVPTAIAFMLPNDPEVWKTKGTKKVFLKNIAHAKFDNCASPIAQRVLVPEQRDLVTFEAYWKSLLGHELSHGLSPSEIEVNGEKTTINKALKELYGPIEECRADIVGIYNIHQLVKKGVLSADLGNKLYATELAMTFRGARFGEAHATGALIAYNYLRERWAYRTTHDTGLGIVTYGENTHIAEPDRPLLFEVDFDKVGPAIASLANELSMIVATGDYERAKVLIEKYGKFSPEMKAAMALIEDIPIDIRPVYTITEQMQNW